MSQFLKRLILTMVLAGVVGAASAFSPLGPLDTWQVQRIGYDVPGLDAGGGPMNLGEEYRWNTKVLTYGFDESFLTYFGTEGRAAIEQAIAILNNLPAASQMSSNLTEFPLNSRRMNYRANALNLLDLKSETLAFLLEQMGLTSPERYVWTLRAREVVSPAVTNYMVIKRNFDPVTTQPTSYVNGSLYTYQILDLAYTGPEAADAVEFPVDPLAYSYTAVASAAEGLWGGGLASGEFFTGLTRDDAGGLRYLYRTNNYNIERLLADATAPTGTFCPYCPPNTGTNVTTNVTLVVDQAIRPGVDKITFKAGQFDSLIGAFITTTNVWTDSYVTNKDVRTQSVQRIITQPDILFAAQDLDQINGFPFLLTRTTISAWQNNDAINGSTTLAGPGVIQAPISITYNKVGPSFFNFNAGNPSYLSEWTASPNFVWGWFDASTNDPVVFPSGTSVSELEQQVLGGR